MATLRIVETHTSELTGDFFGFSTPLDPQLDEISEEMEKQVVRALVARKARAARARLRHQMMKGVQGYA